MHGNIPNAAELAISLSTQMGSETKVIPQSGSDGHEWFSSPAQDLLGKDAGFALSKLLDCSESAAYRYARGERGISGWQFRRLLHTPNGKAWLRIVMDGCQENWWLEIEEALRLKASVDAHYNK